MICYNAITRNIDAMIHVQVHDTEQSPLWNFIDSFILEPDVA